MVVYSWYDLSWRQQRAVVRLARRGQRHPDRRIAQVADDWAWERLGRDPAHAGSIAELIVGALLADGVSVGVAIREHRAAQRIMRVTNRRR